MATSNRDVKMTLSVDTLGEEGIKSLEADIRKLAKGAGEAAPDFERLADEVTQLASQAGAVRGLEQLANEVERLGNEQQQAATKAEALRASLAEQGAVTTAAAARQRELAANLREARDALTDTGAELQKARRGSEDAAKGTQEYEQRIAELIDRKAAEKKAVDAAREALTQANRELSTAGTEQAKLARQSEAAETALRGTERAVKAQSDALAQAQTNLSNYGVATDNLAAAQATVVQRLNAAGTAARQQASDLKAAAAAAAELDAANEQLAQGLQDRNSAAARAYEADAAALAASVEATQRNLAFREAVAQRRAALARETAAAEAAAAERAQADDAARLREQYAAEEAASNRVIALKQAAYARIAALARENADKEAAAAREAAQALANAFDTVGVRGAQAIQREIGEVRAAMELVRAKSGETGAAIAGAMRVGEERISALQRELRGLTGQLTLADKAADLFRNSLGQIAAGNLIADAIGSMVERVKELGRQFLVVNIQAETVRRGLTALYGSVDIANQQFEFLRNASLRAGISMAGITDSFVRFSAATKASGIPLAETNALFEGLTRAGATLGLSTERVQLALDALGQIASKGVVSMEELRQQLGDSLPGALSLTAKGLGVTDAELIKLVETGRLASRDFFPAFTKGLKELQGETTGFQATLGRLSTALTTVAQAAGESGWMQILTLGLKTLGVVVGAILITFQSFYEAVQLALKGVVAFAGALAPGGDFGTSLKFLNEEAAKSKERLDKMADAMTASLDPTSEAAKRMQALAQAQEKQAAAAAVSTQEARQSVLAYADSAQAVTEFSGAQAALSAVSKVLSDETSDLSSKYVRLGVEVAKIQDAQEKEIVVRSKGVDAAKKQAETLAEISDLRENEATQAEVAVAANNKILAATRDEARARESLATTLAVELAEKTKLAVQQDGSIARRKQELDGIQQRLDKAVAEAQVSREEVRTLEAKAVALDLNRQKLQDNSGATDRLRFAMNGLNVELELAQKQFREGAISGEQLAEVERRAAVAAALYVDALQDQIQKLGAVTSAKRANLDMSVAGLQVALEEARSDEARARRIGDETAARRALVRQKEIEIEIARLQVQIQRIEAEGSIAIARAKLEEAKVTGTLTEAKRIELETEIKLAEIKLKQADARDLVVKRMVEEKDALERSKVAVDGETNAVDSNTASWNDNIKAREKAIQLAKAAKGEFAYDEQGFRMNADGSRAEYVTADNNFVPTGLPNGQFNTGRLTQGQIMANVARNGGRYNPADTTDGNAQGIGFGKPKSNTPSTAQSGSSTGDSARDAARYELASYGVGVSDSAPLQQILQLLAEKRGSGSTVTRVVKIELGGRTSTVNVASDADAEALAAVFRQLETAAGRG